MPYETDDATKFLARVANGDNPHEDDAAVERLASLARHEPTKTPKKKTPEEQLADLMKAQR